jgi:two-component system CheB/CheR fusion protein
MSPSSDRNRELEVLLEYLKDSRGFDFRGYKRSSLMRRINKRMGDVQIDSYADYHGYLEANTAEAERLIDAILINVTGFFRDPDTWSYVQEEVIPGLVAHKDVAEPIRVWSAGCASGEEAYTLAIILAEALGADEFRARVRIYATDVDEAALDTARHATYPASACADVPSRFLEKYFERAGTRVTLRNDLRRSVVFGRNDLVQDAPILRIDVLSCRNALMYFEAPTQARVLSRFFLALNEGGYLLLGKAEALLAQGNTFTPVDLTRRVFQKVVRGHVPRRAAVSVVAGTQVQKVDNAEEREYAEASLAGARRLIEALEDELTTSREQLRATSKELEVMNAELQATASHRNEERES